MHVSNLYYLQHVKKEIFIDCVKKCKECHSLGYNINTATVAKD